MENELKTALLSMNASEEDITEILETAPEFETLSFSVFDSNCNVLKNCGYQNQEILKLLKANPFIFTLETSELEDDLADLKESSISVYDALLKNPFLI